MNETAVDLRACINNKAMSHVAMPRYGCHKEVHALPMTRGVYNKVRGWIIPENEEPADEGYLVVYSCGTSDEYVSWSPKHVFDYGYHPLDTCGVSGHAPLKTENLTFGEALELLKKGYRVARAGWNGKGMYLINIGGGYVNHPSVERGVEVESLPFIAMWTVNASGRKALLNGWAPSQTDMLSSDWVWLNEPAGV